MNPSTVGAKTSHRDKLPYVNLEVLQGSILK